MKKFHSLICISLLSVAALVFGACHPEPEPGGEETITGYHLKLTASYPTSVGKWTGDETIGVLFGKSGSVPGSGKYDSPGIVAKSLKATSAGVFEGDLSLGSYTMDNIVGVVYPCDAHSWVREDSDGLRIAMHTGGSYGEEIAYTQAENGTITKENFPVFSKVSVSNLRKETTKGTVAYYTGSTVLASGSSLLRFKISGTPKTAVEGEKFSAIRFSAGADAPVFANTEYVVSSGKYVVEGDAATTAYVKLADTPTLADAASDPIVVYCPAAAHQTTVKFEKPIVTIITDKNSYELELPQMNCNLSAGTTTEIEVDLSQIGPALSPTEVALTLNLEYPLPSDGKALYQWQGNETVGLLFSNATVAPTSYEYPADTVIALPVASIEKGVFAGVVDLGSWTLEDLKAVVYPCDKHSWIRQKSGDLRLAMHSGASYSQSIAYTQAKNGVFNSANVPVFAPLTKDDLSETAVQTYSASASLRWSSALMKINISGQPNGVDADEYITGIELFPATSKAVTGNTEYQLASDSFVINGTKSVTETVELSEQVKLTETTESAPVSIYTSLTARQGDWEFGASGTSYVNVKTNKDTYTVNLDNQTFSLYAGNLCELNVSLKGIGTNKTKLKLTLEYPKTASGATLYEWTGNETIGVLFGNATVSPEGYYPPENNPVFPLTATAKGVFEGTIETGEWTLDDIQAVVYPYDGHSWLKTNSGELRLAMHTGGEYKSAIAYTQEKNGVLNGANAPVFALITKNDLKESGGVYSASKSMQYGCSMINFKLYGIPDGATSDEYIKQIALYPATSKAVTGNSEYKIAAGEFVINGNKDNLATVNLSEQVKFANTSEAAPVSIYATFTARPGDWAIGASGQSYLNVVTNKTTYKYNLESQTFTFTAGTVGEMALKLGEGGGDFSGTTKITLDLNYPTLNDGTKMYEWDGTETVGLLFGNSNNIPSSSDYNAPDQIQAVPLKATGKGVFSGVVDLSERSLNDLQAVVYPYDEHSWLRNGTNGEIRLAVHSGGTYSGSQAYSQSTAGKFNASNAPVWAAITKADLQVASQTASEIEYKASKSLGWGTALMCINLFNTPSYYTSDEYVTQVQMYPDCSKAVLGNTEHKLTASGGTAINGNKSNVATINFVNTDSFLTGTTKEKGLKAYTAMCVRSGGLAFSNSGEGYVKVTTNKSSYTVTLDKVSYDLDLGVMSRMDIDMSGATSFRFESGMGADYVNVPCIDNFAGKYIKLNYYMPSGDITGMPVQFVMHGVDRNGATYRNTWIDLAEKYHIVILAPTFTSAQFDEDEYQMGNVLDKNGNFNSQDKMTYTIIEYLFDYFVNNSGSKATTYNIWGHSAGGQFCHRFMEFAKAPRAKTIIAANPGWYTVPDASIEPPYGWGNAETAIPQLSRAEMYSKSFVLMLGQSDTTRDSNLRTTPEADAQGLCRYERGKFFFNWCQEDAASRSLDFKWVKVEVPGVAHSQAGMAPPAAEYLYGTN